MLAVDPMNLSAAWPESGPFIDEAMGPLQSFNVAGFPLTTTASKVPAYLSDTSFSSGDVQPSGRS
jgi:hypothetical protein